MAEPHSLQSFVARLPRVRVIQVAFRALLYDAHTLAQGLLRRILHHLVRCLSAIVLILFKRVVFLVVVVIFLVVVLLVVVILGRHLLTAHVFVSDSDVFHAASDVLLAAAAIFLGMALNGSEGGRRTDPTDIFIGFSVELGSD